MELAELALALIGVGIIFMVLAVFKTRSILLLLKGKTQIHSWKILFFMMIFFLAGYIAALYLIFEGYQKLIAILTGIVFLLGAVFVFILTRVSSFTINDLILKDKSEELNIELKRNEVIINQKSEALEHTNKELEDERNQLENRIEERTSELKTTNVKLINEIVEHKKTEQELAENKDRLQAQNHALHKITKCFNFDSNIEKSILKVTEIASETTKTERVSVWLYDDAKTNIKCIDLYESSKKVHSDGVILSAKNYPTYFKALELNREIDASDAQNDSRTLEYTETYLKPLGITSMLDAPIRKSGNMIGIICFEHIGPKRTWTIDEQLFAGAIADSISILLESIETIKAEKALQEKEKQLSSIYDTVGDSIFVIAIEKEGQYKFVSVNKVFESTTGINYNQVIGKYVDEIIPADSLNIVLEKYKKAILEKKIIRWEEVSNYPTGQLVGEVSIAPIFDESGNCTFLVGSVHDIADRKKIENKIQKLNEELEEKVKERTSVLLKTQELLVFSEEKYRKIVEEAGDCVYTSDYNGNFTYINPVCKKLTGYIENEIVGKNFLDIIAPEWKGKVAKFYKEQFDNQVPEISFIFPIITKTGDEKWVEQIVTQQTEGDKIIGHHAIVRDITQRKKAEEELNNSNERFLNIFDNNPVGLALSKLESTIFEFVNEIFLTTLGYTKAELIGKTAIELNLIESETNEKIISLMKEQGYVKNIEILARKKIGVTFWALASVQKMIINGKSYALTSFNDITDQKKNGGNYKTKIRRTCSIQSRTRTICLCSFTRFASATKNGNQLSSIIRKKV